jgi:hypothetical protein
MSYLKIAESALAETRKLLKGSLKAMNKAYWALPDGQIDAKSAEALVSEVWFQYRRNALRAKWNDRNEKRDAATKAMDQGNVAGDLTGKNWLEASRAIYDSAKAKGTQWYGNCGEQACVALWIAHNTNQVPDQSLFLATWAFGGFLHQALVLQCSKQSSAYCDPWMNIACEARDYPLQAGKKLDEWTGKGKRLMCSGFGWVEPSNDRVKGFWNNEPDLQNCLVCPKWAR